MEKIIKVREIDWTQLNDSTPEQEKIYHNVYNHRDFITISHQGEVFSLRIGSENIINDEHFNDIVHEKKSDLLEENDGEIKSEDELEDYAFDVVVEELRNQGYIGVFDLNSGTEVQVMQDVLEERLLFALKEENIKDNLEKIQNLWDQKVYKQFQILRDDLKEKFINENFKFWKEEHPFISKDSLKYKNMEYFDYFMYTSFDQNNHLEKIEFIDNPDIDKDDVAVITLFQLNFTHNDVVLENKKIFYGLVIYNEELLDGVYSDEYLSQLLLSKFNIYNIDKIIK